VIGRVDGGPPAASVDARRYFPPPSVLSRTSSNYGGTMGFARTAIILAAGMATRLRPTTDLMPKGLLEIGGKSLLARSIDLLEDAGLSDVLIVTGHHARQIEAALGARRGGAAIRYVHNANYAETGSMISLLAAAAEVTGPALLLESDLLYHPAFLAAATAARDDVILAADISGSGDEVYLAVDDDDYLRFLGKNPPAEWRSRSIGELAGISRISPELMSRFRDRADRDLRNGRGQRHYEEVLFEIAQEGWPIRVELCGGVPWTEIDTPADLERAEQTVWPRLQPPGAADSAV
jgi:choline kinase